MTKFIVKCMFNGTSLTIPVSARTPEVAVAKASKKRIARNASVFTVIERATQKSVHITLGAH